ncbi:hypothetical protein JX265_012661 [Neoarthrinium moseri]|uniref:Epoxide hydrolase N-terminal domain-containing protein n=1 Tax=Neoarthrinium moseri TaxID=1658444 RepID=A0A9Q0AIF7_9PEZI|nr:hypothetical protein JX266_011281 [Neoarthrinium moseri]KAI1853830.1 hypothetical protein JX265_012661 [Neoarthrinium moseri]
MLASVGSPAAVDNFTIDLTHGLGHMIELVDQTQLPVHEEYPRLAESLGISLNALKSLQRAWTKSFDWSVEQAALNRYHQYTATVEDITVYLIHQKSGDPNAIPLILNRGWPGSFLEFIPLIDPLTTVSHTSSGDTVSFDVVVPSLPGYVFSSVPPVNWTLDDTARILNTLMTDVLGYKVFATHGTDWGSVVAYSMYDNFNMTVGAAQLCAIPFRPLSDDEIAARNIKLDPDAQFQQDRLLQLETTRSGYNVEQSTKVVADHTRGSKPAYSQCTNASSSLTPLASHCLIILSDN